ncbi:MAG: hypothetical protein KKI08_22505 [Armatimonadetes bacterium]|nr:hypothetical protein [Armatimonadota bacterium]
MIALVALFIALLALMMPAIRMVAAAVARLVRRLLKTSEPAAKPDDADNFVNVGLDLIFWKPLQEWWNHYLADLRQRSQQSAAVAWRVALSEEAAATQQPWQREATTQLGVIRNLADGLSEGRGPLRSLQEAIHHTDAQLQAERAALDTLNLWRPLQLGISHTRQDLEHLQLSLSNLGDMFGDVDDQIRSADGLMKQLREKQLEAHLGEIDPASFPDPPTLNDTVGPYLGKPLQALRTRRSQLDAWLAKRNDLQQFATEVNERWKQVAEAETHVYRDVTRLGFDLQGPGAETVSAALQSAVESLAQRGQDLLKGTGIYSIPAPEGALLQEVVKSNQGTHPGLSIEMYVSAGTPKPGGQLGQIAEVPQPGWYWFHEGVPPIILEQCQVRLFGGGPVSQDSAAAPEPPAATPAPVVSVPDDAAPAQTTDTTPPVASVEMPPEAPAPVESQTLKASDLVEEPDTPVRRSATPPSSPGPAPEEPEVDVTLLGDDDADVDVTLQDADDAPAPAASAPPASPLGLADGYAPSPPPAEPTSEEPITPQGIRQSLSNR